MATTSAVGEPAAAHTDPRKPTLRPAPLPVPTGNLRVTIPLTNTPGLLVRLCLELRGAGWRAPYPSLDMLGLIAETGGEVPSAAAWCRHYLRLRRH